MKNMIKLPAMVLGLMLFITGFTQKVMAQEDDVSLDTFYQELAPYGTWTQDPDYGYVWRPDVDMSNFQPYYTNGHWAMTEYGNTWVSDYDWGWAPFHYGRWIRNRFNDWIWIPDTVWGPAWVTWRSGGGYYGWAPLGPGIDIEDNADEGGYNIPNDWWVFIPQINIYNSSYPHYYNRNLNIFNQTTYINYTYGRNRHNFYTGPRAEDIRRVTRRDVRVYNVSRSSRPGRTSITNNNTINIYNPGAGRRGNNTPGGRPGNNPVNGQNGQPGRNGRGNNQTPGQPGNNNNPVVNGQNGQPGRGGRGNNQTPGQPGNTNPVVNGQNGQPGRDGRGNNQTPGQPAGNNPVLNGQNGQPGSNQGRRNDMGVRPSVDGRDRTQRMQQGGDAQQQQAQQQAQQQRQQRQQQAQQHQQQQAQQQAQRQQQMQQQQRDGQQRQQQVQQQQAQQRQQQQAQQQAQQNQQRQQQAQQQQQNQQRQQQAQQQQQRQQQAQQQAQQRQQQQQQQRQQQEQQRQQQQQQQAPPDRSGRAN